MNRNKNSREEKLTEKLVNHSIEIDTNNLWQSIRTDLPIRNKRRPILPFVFMAILGMLTGALATYIIIKEKYPGSKL